MSEMMPERYLGDGLYASFDGYQIWLRAPREFGVDHSVAFEPAVLEAFLQFVSDVRRNAKSSGLG